LTLRDWSGFGNLSTLTNMDPGTDWVLRGGKYALDFDASNDYLACNRAINIQQTDSFSIEATIFPTVVSGDHAIIATWDFGVVAGWRLIITAGKLEVALLSFFGGGQRVSSVTSIVANTLQHVCATYDGSSNANGFKLYINGVQSAVTVNANSNPGTLDNALMYIGRIVTNTYYFAGAILNLSVHRRQLLSKEVSLLALRPGVAYELAPRRRSSVAVAAFNRRRRLLVGAGS
jgi:hypothetical protein